MPSFEVSGRDERPDYKTLALCKQAQRSISLTLMGECGDEVLQSLVVGEVVPAPNAGRLLVTVMLRADVATLADVLQRLDAVQGLLRTRLAESISRKRAPEITFAVMPLGIVEVNHG